MGLFLSKHYDPGGRTLGGQSMLRRKNKMLWLVLLLAAAGIFIFSVAQIITTLSAYHEGVQTYDELSKKIITVDTADDIKNAAPISVDFNALLEQNEDVVGWLYCENTPINYPVLQSADNDYYLYRMINKKYNTAGSVFMDYRSNADCSSLNTIVYGHNMKNDSMFGTFTEYNDPSYYAEHSVLWFLTPQQDYKIELIAGYVTPDTSDAYQDFITTDGLKTYLENLVKQSTFVSNVDVAQVDRIVTLSTCSYEYSTARYVLIGALQPLNNE